MTLPLVALVLAAAALLAPAGQAEAAPRNCPYDIRCSIMYNYLTEPQRALFDAMYDALYTGQEVVQIPGGLTDDEINWMIDYIYNEAPELCAYDRWNTQVWGYESGSGWVSTEIHLAYKMPISEQRRFIEDASGVASGFRGKSAADGTAAVFSYVCGRYSYDNNFDASYDTQLAYYAWHANRALCNGYAQTIALLCHLAGYDCSYIDGHAAGGGHAWNVFAAGGTLSYGDATWDDAGSQPNWNLYGMTLSAISSDHDADPEYDVLPGNGAFSKRASAATFGDVAYGSWFYDWVYRASRAGLMTGYNDTAFGPGDPVTRGQVATVLWRAAGAPGTSWSRAFSDVPSGQYYSSPVIWCYQTGIVTGYAGTGRFGPDDLVTREQLATMIWRYARWSGADMSASTATFSGLRGTGSVSPWARDAMVWCAAKGVITGAVRNGGAYLDPQGNADRAQMSKIITVVEQNVLG